MHSFLSKTFGGLTPSYYVRQFLFGAAITAVILWIVGSNPKGLSAYPGLIVFALINTLLYPYARFVYESVIGYIMGDNVFFGDAKFMMIMKVTTMTVCWTMAIFIAPVGLAYLFWRNSRVTAD